MNTAAAVLILMLSVQPDTLFVKERMPVAFTAQLQGTATSRLESIKLMRLQGSGSDREVCVMRESSQTGAAVKGSRVFTCTLSLKEGTQGMLSFTAEAAYPDRLTPLRSRPVFITVIGGISKKDRRSLMKIQTEATALYATLVQQKGLEQARKETVVWLAKQPGVVSVRVMVSNDLAVQVNSGTTLWIRAPVQGKKP